MDIIDLLGALGPQKTDEENQQEWRWKIQFIAEAFDSDTTTDKAIRLVLAQIRAWGEWCWEASRKGLPGSDETRIMNAVNGVLGDYSKATANWVVDMTQLAEVRSGKFWVDYLDERIGEEMLKKEMADGNGFGQTG